MTANGCGRPPPNMRSSDWTRKRPEETWNTMELRIREVRSLMPHGTSLVVGVPKSFRATLGWAKGDLLLMELLPDGVRLTKLQFPGPHPLRATYTFLEEPSLSPGISPM